MTLGTFISITGCTAMSLALSLVIFDKTSSTWLSGIYTAVSLIPSIILPFFLAPMIDQGNPKNLIVRIDLFTRVLYLCFLFYIKEVGFQYHAYLIFSLIISSVDAVYDLAYQCLYPELIPKGLKQKGYAVSAMVEPLATAIVAPIIAGVYSIFGIEIVFLIEGILLITAAAFESRITYEKAVNKSKKISIRERLKVYKQELMEGLLYIKREKGIRNIYSYLAISNATTKGRNLMTMAYFQSSSLLTTAMYSLLISAETVGRFIGGLFSYIFKIPEEKKYSISIKMYMLFEMFDGILLFMTYPIMIILRFICGFIGVNTGTLREAAVQNYFDRDIRARVNGINNIVISFSMLLIQLIVGALGRYFPYPNIVLVMSIVTLICVAVFLRRNKKEVEYVYQFK
ncbi:MAG: MFS transporter [Clostridium sp.]|nr:MFS transporter [Clostridium sp.]MDU7460292.1 MFS transporter [Clostridium sp.]